MKCEDTSKRLREAMAMRKITAVELSNKSGVSKASISQYMNGVHTPSNISAGKMAKVLRVDPAWLMGFDVPMNKYHDTRNHLPFTELNPIIELTPSTSENIRRIQKALQEMDEKEIESLAQYAEFLSRKGE